MPAKKTKVAKEAKKNEKPMSKVGPLYQTLNPKSKSFQRAEAYGRTKKVLETGDYIKPLSKKTKKLAYYIEREGVRYQLNTEQLDAYRGGFDKMDDDDNSALIAPMRDRGYFFACYDDERDSLEGVKNPDKAFFTLYAAVMFGDDKRLAKVVYKINEKGGAIEQIEGECVDDDNTNDVSPVILVSYDEVTVEAYAHCGNGGLTYQVLRKGTRQHDGSYSYMHVIKYSISNMGISVEGELPIPDKASMDSLMTLLKLASKSKLKLSNFEDNMDRMCLRDAEDDHDNA